MENKMKNIDLVSKAKDIALNHKTLYVMGCFGAPMNDKNKKRYTKNNPYNEDPERQKLINAASSDTFGFDCVCLIKGILWGWNANTEKVYGGAVYKSNNVPDIGANKMINACSDISDDFSHLETGEALWMEDHIGIYIGDGLAVECTPKWEDKVQITACNCKKEGYNTRTWTKHGKLPYVEYISEQELPPSDTSNGTPECVSFEVYDVVALKEGVRTYSSGKTIASWVKKAKLYVRWINADQTVTVSTLKEGAVTGTLFAKDLVLIEKANKVNNTDSSYPNADESEDTEPKNQDNNDSDTDGKTEKEDINKPESISPDASPLPEDQGGSESKSENKSEKRKLFWRILRYILDFIKKLLSRE